MFNGGFMGNGAGQLQPQQLQPQGDGMLGNIMQFLQSPEGRGLTQGLLAAGNPSMTTPTPTLGGALGQGLALGEQYRSVHDKKELEKARLELDRLYKTGMLSYHEKELAQRQLESHANQGLKREELELDKQYKGAQIDKILQEAEQRRKRTEWLQSYASGSGDVSNDGSPATDDEAERKRRVGALTALGYDEEAAKVYAEKREKDPAQHATGATISASQESIKTIDSAVRELESLKKNKIVEISSLPGGRYAAEMLNRTQYELMDKAIGNAAKVYAQAKTNGKPTESQIHEAKNILSPAAGETQAEWEKRVDSLMVALDEDKEYQSSIVKPLGDGEKTKKLTYKDILKKYSAEDLQYTAKKRGLTFDQLVDKLIEQGSE